MPTPELLTLDDLCTRWTGTVRSVARQTTLRSGFPAPVGPGVWAPSDIEEWERAEIEAGVTRQREQRPEGSGPAEYRRRMDGQPRVEVMSPDELRARRDALISSLGMSIEELADRADQYTLTPDQLAASDELRQIAYLLGEDRRDALRQLARDDMADGIYWKTGGAPIRTR